MSLLQGNCMVKLECILLLMIITGKNRYETSAKVAERFFSAPEGAVLAYGEDYPDGLCGGSLANAIGGPLLLSRNGRTNYAADFAESTGIKSGFVLGGKTLISDDDARTIFQMGADGEILVK